ncbi:helix-turn-helix domain-containing protein [Mammaliicoccus vitulinus]|uniref:spr1629 family repressor/antitoxin n=1 Tax=Mammaliicoccus vitulinus TaxID=71237 RepID=UPI000F838635|nr:XRE family transcriptional regulator [Mammaliicoccus vitulinus]QQT14991.1 XRE family transcriptional regulator [Mammaliicoccus vitulinus]QQY19719.1 XRE family transcriptional regulator [Mammaliicoccus vitulinus]RTX91830.1 ImmA/IrrE family metallo-endopeptidase [Mammaliicoccus vitulinus]GGI01754.1 transcriptional regulator [Mammaliicoccus vitulinus]
MFIGSNLESIRMLNGLSRKELSEKVDVSEQAIWQYEVKNMMPEINKIYDLSKLFHVKTSYFISEQPDAFKQNSVYKHSIAFRAKSYKVSTKLLNKQHHQANYLSNFTNYLLSYVKSPVMPIFELINQLEDFIMSARDMDRIKIVKMCASISREKLLGNNSNNRLLFYLEKSGIMIYEKSIDNEADAFSFWSDSDIPYIALGNNKGVAVRRNFDIAHELCHLLLHRHIEFDILPQDEYKQIEKEADIFAAEFLLPEAEFINDFNNLTKKSNPDHIKLLKEKWFVSIQAIAMRAYYLDLMTDVQYRYFWSSINKKGYKKREPLDEEIKLAKPVKINSLLNFFFKERVITPEYLLEDLKVSSEFLSEMASIDSRLIDKYKEVNRSTNTDVISNLFK